MGSGHVAAAAAHPFNVPNVSLRLVQPNIPQTEMYGAYRARNWQLLMALSRRPGNPTHIIWPESATVLRAGAQSASPGTGSPC